MICTVCIFVFQLSGTNEELGENNSKIDYNTVVRWNLVILWKTNTILFHIFTRSTAKNRICLLFHQVYTKYPTDLGRIGKTRPLWGPEIASRLIIMLTSITFIIAKDNTWGSSRLFKSSKLLRTRFFILRHDELTHFITMIHDCLGN